MKNYIKDLKLARMAPFILIPAIALSGCGKKVECTYPTRHVHLYTKEIDDDITISKYLDSEYEIEAHKYLWNEDLIEITKVDEELYKLLNTKQLFKAKDNWDYLYYEMSNLHDYLEFFYEYTTTETYTTTDSEGHTTTHTRTVHHEGWTKNPKYSHNTGRTRLAHHRYYGYQVNYTNGKFRLERSPLVDDVREIMEQYPYVPEDGWNTVYKEYRFSRRELPSLSPEDFDVFEQPDLSNTTPNLNTGLTK